MAGLMNTLISFHPAIHCVRVQGSNTHLIHQARQKCNGPSSLLVYLGAWDIFLFNGIH